MLPLALPSTYQPRFDLSGPLSLEPKLDGCRALIGCGIAGAAAHTRMGAPLPGAAAIVAEIGRVLDLAGYVLDGELLLEGRACEEATGAAMGHEPDPCLTFCAFDLLTSSEWHAHESRPWSARRRDLERLLPSSPSVHLVESVPASDLDSATIGQWRDRFVSEGYEGVVAKRAQDPYPFARSTSWLRCKPVHTLDGIIRGVNLGRLGLSSLLVELSGGQLVNVGSGFSASRRADVERWQAAIGHWCEVRYQERTKNGLRFASFLRARPDLDGEGAVPVTRRLRHLSLVA